MIRNYFKIAFRNIKRYSAYSILNITGMAIAMASAILILLNEVSRSENMLEFDF
jgi:putative ABC transport system permease protein